ncbi:MAG: YcxB family protein [Chitinophagales bacterium]|nr:YcxB family protein [Bacteroidota bacterium]MCB9255620.1 YcxB family protein [Chitinophagales bacterium]
MTKLPITYQAEDLEQAFDLHYAKKFPIRSRLVLFLGLILLLAALVLLFIPSPAFPKLKWLLLLVGFFYMGFYWYRKRSLVSLALKNPTIAKMQALQFDSQSLFLIGDTGQIELRWQDFEEAIVNDKTALLYLSAHNFFILPKRFFTSEQWSELLEILNK